jgi:uncharacterized SAM-binding protein YcdF (DUF218 family)
VSHPAATPPATPPAAPAPLIVAASVAGVEAVLLVLFGVAELIAISGARLTMGVTTVVFFVVYGAGLAWCAWRLTRLDSWARAPLVLAQLLQLGVAWSFWGGGSTPVALGLGVLALLVIAGVFHPASLEALREPDQGEPAA